MLFKLVLILIIPFFLVVLLLRLQRIFKWEWLEKILRKADLLENKRRRKYIPLIEILFIPVIIVMAVLSFRHIKPEQPRFDNRIAVIADSTDWAGMEQMLRSSFERIIMTPQPEKAFHLHHVPDPSLSKAAFSQYVIIITSTRGEGAVSDLISARFNQDSRDTGTFSGTFYQPNIRNRIVAVFSADNPDSLKNLLSRSSGQLYSEIERDANNCKRGELFTSKNEVKTSQDLLNKFGWSFTKQMDLKVVEESKEDRFVAFSAFSPGRYLFVHWVENGDTSMVDFNWMKSNRDRLCNIYYDSTYIDSHYLFPRKTSFLGRPALITRGLWADDIPSIGGPFTNYTFYNPRDNRVYMIDVFVFRPGQEKLPFLLPLEVIAHTFISAVD